MKSILSFCLLMLLAAGSAFAWDESGTPDSQHAVLVEPLAWNWDYDSVEWEMYDATEPYGYYFDWYGDYEFDNYAIPDPGEFVSILHQHLGILAMQTAATSSYGAGPILISTYASEAARDADLYNYSGMIYGLMPYDDLEYWGIMIDPQEVRSHFNDYGRTLVLAGIPNGMNAVYEAFYNAESVVAFPWVYDPWELSYLMRMFLEDFSDPNLRRTVGQTVNQGYMDAEVLGNEEIVLVPWLVASSLGGYGDNQITYGHPIEAWFEVQGAIDPYFADGLVDGQYITSSSGYWQEVEYGVFRYTCTLELTTPNPPASVFVNFDTWNVRSSFWPGFRLDNGEYWQAQLETHGGVVGVTTDQLPVRSDLLQNSPNPFNPATMISFALAEPGAVSLQIMDVRGRRVRTLVQGHHNAGIYSQTWRGDDDYGREVASGIYFYQLTTPTETFTRKLCIKK